MISTRLLGAVSIAALIGLAGCDMNDNKANMSSTAPTPPTPTPTLSAQDTTFVNTIAQANTEEINAAQLAEAQSSNPRVKSYAEQMVTDHTAANQKLASIAQSKGVTPSMTPDDAHTQMMSQLQDEHGHAFDHAYISGQIKDHQAVIQALQNEQQTGTDPDLKNFATTTLPVIQHHLQMAEALQSSHGHSMHHHTHHVATSS